MGTLLTKSSFEKIPYLILFVLYSTYSNKYTLTFHFNFITFNTILDKLTHEYVFVVGCTDWFTSDVSITKK